MPRGAHIDREATIIARRSKVFRDPRSFLSTDGRIFLYGKDKERRREECFERDSWICVDSETDEAGFTKCKGVLEMSHDKPYSLGGDDSLTNVHARCVTHHRLRDGHGQPMHF